MASTACSSRTTAAARRTRCARRSRACPKWWRECAGRAPIICDGGFRRGTDIFKALALGATAIGIGRPYVWGLAAFGQEGVEVVLELLRKELEMTMRQAGTVSVAKITRDYVVARS